jgi:hypothetical protein
MRRIFGSKRDEMLGSLRNLHNEELHNFNSSLIIILQSRRIRWAGHKHKQEEEGSVLTLPIYQILVLSKCPVSKLLVYFSTTSNHNFRNWGCHLVKN